MSYFKENGQWSASFRIKDELTGKTRQIHLRGFDTKKLAMQAEQDYRNNISSHIPRIKRSFIDIATEWEKANDTSEGMKRKHREHWNKRFKEYQDKDIKDFTKPMMLQWRIWLSEQDYSTRTKNKTLEYVKSVFRYAADNYNLPNPVALLKPFKMTDTEMLKEMKVWNVDQFNRFYSALDDNLVIKLYFKTLFWTGCRRGEAIALSTDDLEDHFLYIQYSQTTKKAGRKPTKTKQKRRIQIHDELYKELLSLKNHYGSNMYLFGGDEPLAHTTITRAYDKAVKLSGVQRIRIHDFRHSHATILINNGANIVAVSKRLGHSSIEQTLKTYTHLLKDTDEKMMNLISTLSAS